jgi:NAD(P)-dependent dehydrogenase (short-subunit alcohol dehydrogenase family)
MKLCEGRAVVVTGAGGGIGRACALALAEHGASVLVNDVGANLDGTPAGTGPAATVVDEILAQGGRAIANEDDISSTSGAKSVVQQAVVAFGRLDALMNNAGILRDRMVVNMTDAEWDDVIRVHLRGTFLMTREAANHWRQRSKNGGENDARIVNVTSASGLYGNPGQTNYGAAKAGIAAFTVIAAMELARYGATVNAISPGARTRMTAPLQKAEDAAPAPGIFDRRDPANIAPLVVWLASAESASVTGRVFNVMGGSISVAEGWHAGPRTEKVGRWDPRELRAVIGDLVARAMPNAGMDGVPLRTDANHEDRLA